jgi:ATP-binding cassette subfamily C (CFTR/MRP) protein 1
MHFALTIGCVCIRMCSPLFRSGKSSLLTALLGEMSLVSGSIHTRGQLTYSYCDQRPWIMNASVQDNILMGQPMDEARFSAAVHASCLDDDIKMLPAGLRTEIGE